MLCSLNHKACINAPIMHRFDLFMQKFVEEQSRQRDGPAPEKYSGTAPAPARSGPTPGQLRPGGGGGTPIRTGGIESCQ